MQGDGGVISTLEIRGVAGRDQEIKFVLRLVDMLAFSKTVASLPSLSYVCELWPPDGLAAGFSKGA